MLVSGRYLIIWQHKIRSYFVFAHALTAECFLSDQLMMWSVVDPVGEGISRREPPFIGFWSEICFSFILPPYRKFKFMPYKIRFLKNKTFHIFYILLQNGLANWHKASLEEDNFNLFKSFPRGDDSEIATFNYLLQNHWASFIQHMPQKSLWSRGLKFVQIMSHAQ